MTDEQTCSTRDLVVAIRQAYRAGEPGYDRGAAKLGVEPLLRHLVVAGVVPVGGDWGSHAPAAAILLGQIDNDYRLPDGRIIPYGSVIALA